MKTKLPKIIAVDFDGTCVTHEFPQVGRDTGAAPVLRRLVEAGCKLVLFTMRSDNRPQEKARNGKPMNPNPLTDAVQWFEKNGIPLFGINTNPEQFLWTSSPKAYAELYIDDAAFGAPLIHPKNERPHICWDTVEKTLFPSRP